MSARIAILVEGATEKAFKPILLRFLSTKLSGKMPKLSFVVYDFESEDQQNLSNIIEEKNVKLKESFFHKKVNSSPEAETIKLI